MTEGSGTAIGAVAHYNLLEKLEPAGPGELFRARDTRRGRTVTLRLLPPSYFASDAAAREWLAHTDALKRFSHPNTIAVFDAGLHDGRVFLAFEFLKGQSLRGEMAGHKVNTKRAVDLAVQLSDAIAAVHAAGFVHGGLSPDTIVVTARGHAKIPAIELAAHGGFEETGTGVRLRDYDSPEEARGEQPDARSDIYSVGALLFEMLTSRRPLHKGAAAPSASNPHVTTELDSIVLRAVSPNPDRRHQDAAVLAAELRAVSSRLEAKRAESTIEPPPQTRLSGIVLTSVGMLVLAALVLWLVFNAR